MAKFEARAVARREDGVVKLKGKYVRNNVPKAAF